MAKIGKRSIDKLASEQPGTVLRDDDIPGFHARLNQNGSITFAFDYRAGFGRGAPTRRFTIGRYGALTPEEARQRAKALAADVATGGDPAAKKSDERATPLLREFAEKWLERMEALAVAQPESAPLRPKTVSTYRSHWRATIGPALGGMRLDLISKQDVIRMHRAAGERHPVAANRATDVLAAIFRAAAEDGLIAEGTNPSRGIKKFKESAKERFLCADELSRLGEAIRILETVGVPRERPKARPGRLEKHIPKNPQPYKLDQWTAAAFRLLIFTGARLREILEARWSDVDMARGILMAYSKTGRRPILLPAPALAVLDALERAGEYVVAGMDPSKPRADLKGPWAEICKLADLPDLRIHDLRHSYASVAVERGAPLLVVGKILGHANASTTMRYSHLSADPVRAAAESAAGQIAAAMDGKGEVVPFKRGGTK